MLALLQAAMAASAAGSLMRIDCEGDDAGAEVSINGIFKGECPLDVKVNAGVVKLRVVKKIDDMQERVFEQEMRIGDDVVKKVVAHLSAPQPSAEAMKLAAARQAVLAEKQRRAEALVNRQISLAESGDVTAMLALAERFQSGNGVSASDEQALGWIRRAAEAGHAPSMVYLATRYETGKGVKKDFDQAASWYQKAADLENIEGMAGLGSMYFSGTGVVKDLGMATSLWSKASEAGNSRRMNGMGLRYFK